MSVIIDDKAGFCFGVVKAIGAAEEQLQQRHQLFCLGDIVHNNEEVQRLSSLGMEVIDHERMAQLAPDADHNPPVVLIRAHGEPPETYELAQRQGIALIDATCPIVLALQKRIRQGYEEMTRCGGHVAIFGKKGHAEVIGLNGQTGNHATIISDPDDIEGLDVSHPLRLYSQTTKSREDYRRLIANIEARIESQHTDGEPAPDFVAYDTICSRVANRAKELEAFASSVDRVLFVSGVNSSNGHYLYEYCRKVQPQTLLISSPNDEALQTIRNEGRIGITGATSTPRWLMEQIKSKIENAPQG